LEQAIRILKGVGLKHKIFETLGEFYPELKEVLLSQIDVQNHSSTVFPKNIYPDPEGDR
jgi:hypothetical protein